MALQSFNHSLHTYEWTSLHSIALHFTTINWTVNFFVLQFICNNISLQCCLCPLINFCGTNWGPGARSRCGLLFTTPMEGALLKSFNTLYLKGTTLNRHYWSMRFSRCPAHIVEEIKTLKKGNQLFCTFHKFVFTMSWHVRNEGIFDLSHVFFLVSRTKYYWAWLNNRKLPKQKKKKSCPVCAY